MPRPKKPGLQNCDRELADHHDCDLDSLKCDIKDCIFCYKRAVISDLAERRLVQFVETTPYCTNEDMRHVYKGLVMYDVHIEALKKQKHGRKPTIMFQPHIDSRQFYNFALCDEDSSFCMKRLKTAYAHICSDYETLRQNYPIGWQQHNTQRGRWETYTFVSQGKLVDAALFSCPTVGHLLLNLHPAWVRNCFGYAGFSVVYPNTVIPTHTGPCNTRIRAHLAIHVPDSSGKDVECYIEVGGKKKGWKEGELLMFDDSFPHSITYTAPADSIPRVVFYIDFWHPDIEPLEKEALNCIYQASAALVEDYAVSLHKVEKQSVVVKEKYVCPRRCDC